MKVISEITSNNLHRCVVPHSNGKYRTDEFENLAEAEEAARKWIHWFENVQSGKVSSVYYILAIPDTWPGPPPGAHRYSGLKIKIGIAKDVRKRLQDLKTGSSAKLIIHALEPGGKEVEQVRHNQFKSERRAGEWFSCSEALVKHIFQTWHRNNLLPREHQLEIVWLQERIDAYIEVRKIMGCAPDMVNPSINEPWCGNVLVDLTYAHGFISRRPVKEAYPIHLSTDGRSEPLDSV